MFKFILMRFVTIILVFCSALRCFGQDVITSKIWDHRYGGNNVEIVWGLTPAKGGGYVIAGQTESDSSGDKTQASRGYIDYWVVKVNDAGIKLWDYRFGGSSNNGASDVLRGIHPTADSGYILVGASNTGNASASTSDKTEARFGNFTNATMDYWIIKINKNGVKQWDHVYGGTDEDYATTVCATKSGGYLVGGYSSSGVSGNKNKANKGGTDFYIIKFNANGQKEWDQVYGGPADDELKTITTTSDGGYLLGGTSLSGIGSDKSQSNRGLEDYWVVKIDSMGSKQWDARFGGAQSDLLFSVKPATDGGYLLAGYTQSGQSGDKSQPSRGGFADAWIVKINATGIKQWDYRFGTDGEDGLVTILPAEHGGFLLGGTVGGGKNGDASQEGKGGFDYWLIQVDSVGNKQWDKRFGGNIFDQLIAIQKNEDGTYVLAGSSESDSSGDKSEGNRGIRDYWLIKIQVDAKVVIGSIGNFCGRGASWVKFNESSMADTLTFAYSDNNFSSFTAAGSKIIHQAGIDSILIQWPLSPTANNYKLRVISQNPPDTTYSNSFVFNPSPVAGISLSGDSAFCSGDSLTITATPIGSGFNYNWLRDVDLLNINSPLITAKLGGAYKVIVSNPAGCKDTSRIVQLFEKPKPAKPIITEPTHLQLQSSPAFAYQWLFNTILINNATSQTLSVTQNGNYEVKTDSTNGCSNISDVYTIANVGSNEAGKSFFIQLYPNPAHSSLFVEGSEILGGNLTLTDVNGKVVATYLLENSHNKITIEEINNGIYFYTLLIADHRELKGKMIIEHGLK